MGKKGFAKKLLLDRKKERALNTQPEVEQGAEAGWLPAAKSLNAAGKKQASENRGIRKDKSAKRSITGGKPGMHLLKHGMKKAPSPGGSTATPIWAQPLPQTKQVQGVDMSDA